MVYLYYSIKTLRLVSTPPMPLPAPAPAAFSPHLPHDPSTTPPPIWCPHPHHVAATAIKARCLPLETTPSLALFSPLSRSQSPPQTLTQDGCQHLDGHGTLHLLVEPTLARHLDVTRALNSPPLLLLLVTTDTCFVVDASPSRWSHRCMESQHHARPGWGHRCRDTRRRGERRACGNNREGVEYQSRAWVV